MMNKTNPERSHWLMRILSRQIISSEQNEMIANKPSRQANSSHEMQLRLAEFESARVEDVMIPRAEIHAVEVSTPLRDLLQIFSDSPHSRMPIYRETLDDPIGFIHIKDLVTELAKIGKGENMDPDDMPLWRLKRNIEYVPPSMSLPVLLVKMQSARSHLALVVDEYGGTDGLVTLEDLVEQIVGEIADEHDDDIQDFYHRGRGLWEADARAQIDEVGAALEHDLHLVDYEDEIDTLGGLIFALAGRVPQRGEIIHHPVGIDFEILEGDARRVKRLRFKLSSIESTDSVRLEQSE